MQAANKKTILLWGATQVGKTAMLATAFYGSSELAAARREGDSSDSVATRLFDVWRRLRNNQYVPPTSEDCSGVGMTTRNGTEIEFLDVRGGMTLEIYDDVAREPLHRCDAVLFLAEYAGSGTGNQMVAIEGGLQEAAGKPCALAFTKCERHLKYEDPVWDMDDGWLEKTPAWTSYSPVLRRFERRAWPTSAFGYNSARALPAVTLGEFGQVLPFGISPRNVALPMFHLLIELEAL